MVSFVLGRRVKADRVLRTLVSKKIRNQLIGQTLGVHDKVLVISKHYSPYPFYMLKHF